MAMPNSRGPVKKTAENPKPFAGKPGPGRPKGAPNKLTMAVKDMVLAALDKAGGVNYLVQQAQENPTAFMTLVGKIIPTQVNGPGENGEHLIKVNRIEIVAASGNRAD